MRLALAAGAALLAAPALASNSFLDFQTAAGTSGGAWTTATESGTTFDRGRYRIAARAATARFPGEAAGTREEYSARLTRELYFVTVSGRLGVSPSSAQGAGYRLASGETWFTFYGTELAPEHPELSAALWESSGSIPSPESLDREWITRLGGVYTNIDNHIQTANGQFLLVQGVWQFSALETYRETTTAGLQVGGDRLNRTVDGTSPAILQDAIEYWGNYLPIPGWPNNWISARGARAIGSLTLALDGTRLNLLGGAVENILGAEAAWRLGGGWTVKGALEHKRRVGRITRDALALGVSRSW